MASTRRALRMLETASPPTFYLPKADVCIDLLRPSATTSVCEWKGLAHYYSIQAGTRVATDATWTYPKPFAPFGDLLDYFAFYPERVDECTVAGERVSPQPGGFYAGWVTSEIVGPFKGEPGTLGW